MDIDQQANARTIIGNAGASNTANTNILGQSQTNICPGGSVCTNLNRNYMDIDQLANARTIIGSAGASNTANTAIGQFQRNVRP